MSGRRAVRRLLGGRVFGKPLGVWLLWVLTISVLAFCPVIISDPGMWPYLFDPELLALVAVVGVQYTRMEAGVLRLQLRAWWEQRGALRRRAVRSR